MRSGGPLVVSFLLTLLSSIVEAMEAMVGGAMAAIVESFSAKQSVARPDTYVLQCLLLSLPAYPLTADR